MATRCGARFINYNNRIKVAAAIGSFCAISDFHAGTTTSERSRCDAEPTTTKLNGVNNKHKLIFLGTGSSTGCPKPLCSLLSTFDEAKNLGDDRLSYLTQNMQHKCKVSRLATQGDPKKNRNYRNNPSLLISFFRDGRRYNVVIDVGKTFREGAIRWMPQNGVHSIDAIVLTHEHFDAVGGLDDVRGFQAPQQLSKTFGDTPPKYEPLPVYLSQHCFEGVKACFSYLVPATTKRPGSEIRAVAALDFRMVEAFRPFEPVPGFEMTPLPVMHGEDLVCFGYSFQVGQTNIVYLSDISRMPEETQEYILRMLPPTDILVVDSLLMDQKHNTHFSLKQALALISKVRPRQTAYIVGMNCDAFPDHDVMNSQLQSINIEGVPNVQLAHDGLVLGA